MFDRAERGLACLWPARRSSRQVGSGPLVATCHAAKSIEYENEYDSGHENGHENGYEIKREIKRKASSSRCQLGPAFIY